MNNTTRDGPSMRKEHLASDPCKHPAIDAVSMLAKEEAWHMSTHGSDRIVTAWSDAMSWCISLLNHDRDRSVPLHLL